MLTQIAVVSELNQNYYQKSRKLQSTSHKATTLRANKIVICVADPRRLPEPDWSAEHRSARFKTGVLADSAIRAPMKPCHHQRERMLDFR